MSEKVEVYRDAQGEWRWRRKEGNGEIVSTSGEGYLHKYWCVEIAKRLNPDAEFEIESGEDTE